MGNQHPLFLQSIIQNVHFSIKNYETYKETEKCDPSTGEKIRKWKLPWRTWMVHLADEDSKALIICCFCSVTCRVWLFVTPWTLAHQASMSFIISWSLLKLMSIEYVMPPNHLTLCRSLLLLPSIFPSIGVFSNEWALHIRWPKYWSFSFSINPSNEYAGLVSLKIDWFDLLAVQGTLKSSLTSHFKTSVF